MTQIRFSKDHEWLKSEGSEALCGISDYAQKALGDIVYVELPGVGKSFKKGEQVAVVESAKAASEVYAPADGEIIAINSALTSDPAVVNGAPQTDGWFFKLKLAHPAQADDLMDEAGYNAYVKGLLAG